MSDESAHTILEPAASRVRDPRTGRSVWLSGMLHDAQLSDTVLEFTLQTTRQHTAEERQRIKDSLLKNIERVGWRGEVRCHMAVGAQPPSPAPAQAGCSSQAANAPASSKPPPKKDPVRGMSGPGMGPHGGPIEKAKLPGVKHIIAVASGKGGVGKSTVATNLAVALAKRGLKVGMMDADIYGPSLPTMLGVHGKPFANEDKKIIPLEAHGIKVMSIGFLVDEGEPVIWRGPMVMGVVRQFLQDVHWDPTDVLIIDLPPGTGDAQLTMIQAVDLSGAVVVTTPQDVAVLDAVRGVAMFRKLEVPVFGVVENMSWIDLHGGGRMHPFGQGGGAKTAKQFGLPLLGQLPLDGAVRAGGDAGRPIALGTGPLPSAFDALAETVVGQLGL